MKAQRIIYWIATALLCAMMLFAAFNYIFKHRFIVDVFVRLGFPVYIIYPLAVAKLSGLVGILQKKSKTLKEWAYAGFFFNFLLALSAHIHAGDEILQSVPASVCLILLFISYFLGKRIEARG